MSFQDFVVAGRVLRKSPVFTLTAVITIALGVGASTAIFSVTNAVLLRPLPYRNPDRLVIAGMDLRTRHVRDLPFSNADYIDLREGTKNTFEDLGGVFTTRAVVPREDDSPEQVHLAIVTTNFFRVIGAGILFGRDFNDQDGIPQPAAPPPGVQQNPPPARLPNIAIVSYEYFQRRFGGNTAVLGQPIRTSGQFSPVIVGVLAPGVRLYFPPQADQDPAPDIWVANRLGYDAANRNGFSIRPVARLKPGVSVEQAQAAADSVAAEARKNFLIERTAGYYIHLEGMGQHMVAEVRPAILALMGSVIFLLLIACANVANLLLVRVSLREREFAVRAALGGSRWRLISPLLTESLVLAAIGTVVGLALAWGGIYALRALAPANLPRLDTIRIDAVVLAFSALAGILAAVVFGLAPAWRASRPDLMNVLRGTSRTTGLFSGSFARNLVVLVEVALSFVLLVGCGLMFRSFLDLQRIDPGFDPHRLLTFTVNGNRGGTKPEQRAAFIRQIQTRLSAIPGVQSVTASTPFPLAGGWSPIRWGKEEALSDATKFQATDFALVLPGYFEAMRVPLLAGRTFTDQDNLQGRNLVLVDEFMAKKAFPNESAVGKRIVIRLRTPEPEWVEVIGVIAHQRATSLAEPGREQTYFADAFIGAGAVNSWAIRTAGDPSSYSNTVRQAIKEVDPHLLVTEMEPADDLVLQAQASTRFSLLLIAAFAVIAGVLAGVGLYGVLSTAVRQRTSEIGVRMALGAERASIFQLIVGQGLRLSAIGIAAGLVAALILTRVMMSTMLIGVKPTDPVTFTTMTVIFFGIAALASWLPARRASGLNPTTALREQ